MRYNLLQITPKYYLSIDKKIALSQPLPSSLIISFPLHSPDAPLGSDLPPDGNKTSVRERAAIARYTWNNKSHAPAATRS